MILIWHPETKFELSEGAIYYNRLQPGVGDELLDEIEFAVRKVIRDPGFFREFDPPYRKIVTNRFPYQLIYRLEGEEIRVIAVMHQSQRPGYWKDREDSWL